MYYFLGYSFQAILLPPVLVADVEPLLKILPYYGDGIRGISFHVLRQDDTEANK